jgi:hypothetical protein
MDRRNFLIGTFGGLTAGGIVLAAEQNDIAAFVSTVQKNAPLTANPVPPPAQIRPGEMLFDHLGRPVAIIQKIEWHRELDNVTKMGDVFESFAPGVMSAVITAVTYGPAALRVG